MELRYWGATSGDADNARMDAHTKLSMILGEGDTTVSVEERHVGGQCPIKRRDDAALYQDATYNAAWALYKVGPKPATKPTGRPA